MGIRERKERQFQQRQGLIVDVATELFRNNDWDDIAIDQIAERAEIGKGTIYRHFASKDELFAEMYLMHADAVWQGLKKLDLSGNVADDCVKIMRYLWEHNLADPELHLKASQYIARGKFLGQLSPQTRKRIEAVRARVTAFYVEKIQKGIQEGLFLPRPVDEMLLFADSALNGSQQTIMCMQSYPPEGGGDLRERFEPYFRYMTAAILRGWGCPEDRLARFEE